MNIRILLKQKKISIRTFNVCISYSLTDLEKIKKYYSDFGSFLKLANCGRKSNEELTKLCEEDFKLPKSHFQRNENPINKIILTLSRTQRELINSFILISSSGLSVRSKTAISLYLDKNFRIKNFAKIITLAEKSQIKTIKNIGAKSILELEAYIKKIKDFLLRLYESKDEKELISLKNRFLIQHLFSIANIPDEILESESIFKTTDFLLSNNALFDETQTNILQKTFKIYQNSKGISLKNISLQVGLSRERVRQIKKFCLDELSNKLLFLKDYNDDLLQNYNIDTELDQIKIDAERIDLINDNNIKLSKGFITYVLFSYLKDKFALAGNIEDVLTHNFFKNQHRYNWKNFYLIKREIISKFNFDSFVEDINSRLNDKITRSYSFNFKSYISKFLINENLDLISTIFPIAENIINEEFGLNLDLDENICFKRNTKKSVFEYSYEALEVLNKPSKVSEIIDTIKEIYPYYDTDESKIRSSMKRENGFIPIGRKSVYGLQKWEDELEGFKGGTIREIVVAFLSNFDEPKHISEIASHVLKYRPKSNQYSIFSNLKLEDSGSYQFFKHSMIGLADKVYDKIFLSPAKIEKKTWFESFDLLNDFIQIENRLPLSNNAGEEESKIYRWFNLQKKRKKEGKLNAEKMKLLEEIDKLLPPEIKLNTIEQYEILYAFVADNYRLPSSNKHDEKELYKFYSKQMRLLKSNELKREEEAELVKIAILLKKYLT